MSGAHRMNCDEVAPLLVFLACDEVTAEERGGIESHIAECAECRGQLAEVGAFQESLTAITQAADELDRTGTLLAQCRSELYESLDQMSAPPVEQESWRPFGFMRRWMALHAPGREATSANWHAHLLATTRKATPAAPARRPARSNRR